jgi:hypothetical protein
MELVVSAVVNIALVVVVSVISIGKSSSLSSLINDLSKVEKPILHVNHLAAWNSAAFLPQCVSTRYSLLSESLQVGLPPPIYKSCY